MAATERTRLLDQTLDPIHDHVEPDDLTDPTKLSIRNRNLILGAVWVGVALGALDTTIVASLRSFSYLTVLNLVSKLIPNEIEITVTDISSSFGSSNQSSWLGTSYLLSTATFTPLYGRLSDILGRR